MEIAIVTDQPHWTGVGIYALELFELLKPQIENLKLIYTGAVNDDFPNQEKLEYMKRTKHYFNRPFLIRSNYRKLLKDKSFSGYLFHYVGTDYSSLKKRPGIITVHDALKDRWLKDPKLNFVGAVNELERMRKFREMLRLSRHAVLIISISKKTHNDFKNLTGSESIIIYHWILDDKFKKRSRIECLNKLGLNKDYRYILSVGNNRPNKRIDLIEKFADSLPQEFRLIKIGASVKSKNAINIAHVEDDLYPLYFNVSDAYLHLSDDEGFGIPLLEALGSETPIICRDTEINNEILGDACVKISEGGISGQAAEVISKLDDPSFSTELLKRMRVRRYFFEKSKISEIYRNAYTEAWASWSAIVNPDQHVI